MDSMASAGSFTGYSENHAFNGFLLDVDGTVIDTTSAITKHWKKLASPLSSKASLQAFTTPCDQSTAETHSRIAFDLGLTIMFY